MDKKTFATGVTTGILLSAVTLVISPYTLVKSPKTSHNLPLTLFAQFRPTPTPSVSQNLVQIKEVLPENYKLGIAFKDAITRMVQDGAIDKDKFLKLYETQNTLTTDQKKLLDVSSEEEIVVTAQNAPILLNLLWPLGITNHTSVLTNGPMGTQYSKDIGNFASTGGWTLGKQDGGKMFNKFSIIPLTPEQEVEVAEIAQNIYRPCCGNSTYFPDCNHGAAMLGFIELAVAQGMSKEQIYKNALVLNSYWFPQTYVEVATYFKVKKGLSWDKVDAKEALSADYSSGQGSAAINKELQTEDIVPKVKGGSGCGV